MIIRARFRLLAGLLLGFAMANAVLAINEDRCAVMCSTAFCDETCQRADGSYTTCAQFRGFPANDYDGDGVSNAADNCLCTANTNQANCDGDAFGDACDAANVKWVFVQDIGRCAWDGDTHLGYFTVEQYASKKYKNVCTGTFCYDKYLLSSATCTFGSGCGSSEGSCCTCRYPLAGWCQQTAFGCGSPACPF